MKCVILGHIQNEIWSRCMRSFFLSICTVATCLLCTGCVMTRFTESLLEYGVRYTRPDITTDVAEKDQYFLKAILGKNGLTNF